MAVPAEAPELERIWAILLLLPAEAPLTPDCTTVHENVVPVTDDVKEILVVTPLQIVCDEGVAFTFGIGLTVTVVLTAVPEHPLAVGVMVYVAVPWLDPELVRIWAILLPLPAVAPVTPDCVTVQLNVVPATPDVRFMDVGFPLQIVCAEGVAVTFGIGLTVIVTVIGLPMQVFAVGVIV